MQKRPITDYTVLNPEDYTLQNAVELVGALDEVLSHLKPDETMGVYEHIDWELFLGAPFRIAHLVEQMRVPSHKGVGYIKAEVKNSNGEWGFIFHDSLKNPDTVETYISKELPHLQVARRFMECFELYKAHDLDPDYEMKIAIDLDKPKEE